MPRLGDHGGYVLEDRQRALDEVGESFDRVEYAMRALRLLRPRRMTVAVRESRVGLSVDRGRDWARGPADEWAVVAIPPSATRETIAVTIAELAGVQADSFAFAIMMTQLQQD
jgi:hypothetical protein